MFATVWIQYMDADGEEAFTLIFVSYIINNLGLAKTLIIINVYIYVSFPE